MNMNKNKTNRYMPFIMALCVVLGIIIGTFFSNHFAGNRLNVINSGSNRLNNLLHLIDDQYVDAVNIDSLVDKAIPQILAELDPHSVYISAKDAAAATDDLKGSFSGVGIEFVIRQDTIHVQNVIQNGPAEKAGLLAGDKIVAVDGKPFVGKIVTNQEAMHRLKGPKDTKVKIGVIRYGSKKVQTFTVTRGEIPTKSVTAAYMLDDNTGYIRIKNFGENTYPEMLIALAKLSQQGFKNLCIDLRDNSGGYLTAAVNMANEFLPEKKLILYTQGRKSPRQDYPSDGKGSYRRFRWLYSSMRVLLLRLRSLQEPCRTTTVPPSSAAVRSVRDWYSSRSSSQTTVSSVLPSPVTILHQADASRSHIPWATAVTTSRISSPVMSMASSSRRIASSIPVRLTIPASAEWFMVVVASLQISSFRKIPWV